MKIFTSIVLITILTHQICFAQIRIEVDKLPENSQENSKVFMASSLNNWNPNDQNFELKKNEIGKFSIEIPEGNGSFEFKFTQGNWETAEADKDGNSIANRKISFIGNPQIIKVEIQSWSTPLKKENTASPNVKILSENFEVPQLKTSRRIWIYLPQNYHKTKKKYPVIYMMDGQNLFDNSTSFSGEWKVDETLDSLCKQNEFQAIVVGIDNGGSERLNEYSPWKNEKYGGGKGELFTEFLVKNLKPYIDQSFRTLPQPKNTAFIGSSMGGLIALYAGTQYPDVFGKLGIFSPAFWFAENDLHLYLHKNQRKIRNSKFYFLAGKNESENMVSDMQEIVTILQQKKVPSKNIVIKIVENGTHSENYWAKEFPAAFIWLFKK